MEQSPLPPKARTLRHGFGKKQIALGGQVRRCSVCTRPLKPWFKEEAEFCSRSCVAVAHFRANSDCRVHGYCSALLYSYYREVKRQDEFQERKHRNLSKMPI